MDGLLFKEMVDWGNLITLQEVVMFVLFTVFVREHLT